MPHRIKIVPFLASIRLQFNNFFKLILVLVRRRKQAVLALIQRFLIALTQRGPPPNRAVPTPMRGACSHPELQLAACPPRQAGIPAGMLHLSLLLHMVRID